MRLLDGSDDGAARICGGGGFEGFDFVGREGLARGRVDCLAVVAERWCRCRCCWCYFAGWIVFRGGDGFVARLGLFTIVSFFFKSFGVELGGRDDA